jgi:iron complex outermembrane receptor protein
MRDRADFSLVESLRTIPGFRVQQLGGFGRTASIKTRGLRNQDTAVLLDGVRFRDASSITGDASAFLSDFTLTNVSKIEVLRGSGSSLYGTNAIGGTLDLQTPKPLSGWHGQVGGAFGGYGLGRFRGNISNGTDKFGFNAGVSRTVYTKGIDGDDDARNTNFQSRIEYNPFEKTNISARFFVSDAYARLNSSPDTFGTLPTDTSTIIDAREGVNFVFDRNDPDNFQKSKFFNGQIVLTQVLAENLVFQGFYSGLKTSRKNTNGVLGVPFQPFAGDETYIYDGQIHTLNGHLNWTARNNQLTAGYEYEWEKFGNDGVFTTVADNFSTRARQSSNTVYVQDLIGFFNNKLQISGAFRAQWFSLETPTFSSTNFPNRFTETVSPPSSYTGDGSVSYYFEQTGTKIRAHVGNGYRVPSLYERFGSYFFFNAFFGLGNPALKPERSIAADFGVEQSLFKKRAKLTATYFYTRINDEVTYLPTDDLNAPAYFNADRHFSRGAEFSAQLKPTASTDIFASYTFTNSDVRNFRRQGFLPPATLVSRDRKAFGIPAHQFTLVATQRIKRAWINFDFLATSDYLAPIFSNTSFQSYVYRFKGNRRGDLTAGYTFGFRNDSLSLRLFGTVENLFDYEYFENGFRTSGQTGRIGLSFGF